MSFLVALIGTRDTTSDDIDAVLDYHLRQCPAFWSRTKPMEMTLFDDTGDPRDEGYMADVRELRTWLSEFR